MVKLIICSLLSRLQANLKTSHEFITVFFLLLRFKRIFFFNSIDQNYHQINLPRRLPPLLPTAIVGSNSNRRASVACEQAFGRAGNWGKGKAFPFAIFFPKKNREPVHRLRVCDSTCNVWSWLSSDGKEGVKISRERVDSKGLYGRWRLQVIGSCPTLSAELDCSLLNAQSWNKIKPDTRRCIMGCHKT